MRHPDSIYLLTASPELILYPLISTQFLPKSSPAIRLLNTHSSLKIHLNYHLSSNPLPTQLDSHSFCESPRHLYAPNTLAMRQRWLLQPYGRKDSRKTSAIFNSKINLRNPEICHCANLVSHALHQEQTGMEGCMLSQWSLRNGSADRWWWAQINQAGDVNVC